MPRRCRRYFAAVLLAAAAAMAGPLGTAMAAANAEAIPVDASGLREAARRAEGCGAPADALAAVLDAAQADRLDGDDAAAVLSMLLTACAEGLPGEPLAVKAAEGLAKGVPGPRLRSALRALLDDLRFAGRTLGEYGRRSHQAPQREDVAALARVLAGGMPREDAAAFAEAAPGAPPAQLVVALENLSLLPQAGFDPRQLQAVLYSGLRAASLTPDWAYLPRVVRRALERGIGRDDILAAVDAELAGGGSLRGLLLRLGFTDRPLVDADPAS